MAVSKPQMLCWQVCDAVHVDPSTGKHTLLGCFANIRLREVPEVHPRMVWFLTLSDVQVGEHQLAISYGPAMDALKPVVDRPFRSQSPLHRINLINEVHQLRFEQTGQYTILVEIDDEPLLATSLGVHALSDEGL